MIDTDKMKAALAATPLCQGRFTRTDGDGTATKLCAISALVSFAGVQPELIAKMDAEGAAVPVQVGWATMYAPAWVAALALPVLRAEYSIPREIAIQFPGIFDKQENEMRGVVEVLALCERYNMDEQHTAALAENAMRFPQESPVGVLAWYATAAGTWSIAEPAPVTHLAEKPKGQTDTGKSKFWTASKKPNVPKLLTV